MLLFLSDDEAPNSETNKILYRNMNLISGEDIVL